MPFDQRCFVPSGDEDADRRPDAPATRRPERFVNVLIAFERDSTTPGTQVMRCRDGHEEEPCENRPPVRWLSTGGHDHRRGRTVAQVAPLCHEYSSTLREATAMDSRFSRYTTELPRPPNDHHVAGVS